MGGRGGAGWKPCSGTCLSSVLACSRHSSHTEGRVPAMAEVELLGGRGRDTASFEGRGGGGSCPVPFCPGNRSGDMGSGERAAGAPWVS